MPPQAPVSDKSIVAELEQFALANSISPALLIKTLGKVLIPDKKRAYINLARYLHTGFSSSIISELISNSTAREILLTVFSHSQYLADIVIRDTGVFQWLLLSEGIRKKKTKEELEDEVRGIESLFKNEEPFFRALKRFHRREMLRIGAKEILLAGSNAEASAELSALADVIVEACLRKAFEKSPLRNLYRSRIPFSVVGLGKLGGGELNFSSDIDLLFVYDDSRAPSKRIEPEIIFEQYSRLAEQLLSLLTLKSEEGHFYRVDMRLRPDGASGSLVLPITSYLTYYESRGEVWERQMLLKARIIAGDKETGAKFMDAIGEYVYSRMISESPLKEIAAMKERIEAASTDRNIKLGKGGIRDIEFIAQSLQLLHAPSDRRLRISNTRRIITELERAKLLTQAESTGLIRAYEFLRVVEHRLQLLHGLQTHSLPDSSEEAGSLARRLGYRSIASFMNEMNRHRNTVAKVFKEVIGQHKAVIDSRDRVRALRLPQSLVSLLPMLGDPHVSSHVAAQLERTQNRSQTITELEHLASAESIRRSLNEALKNKHLAQFIIRVASHGVRVARFFASEPLFFESLVGQPERFLSEEPDWQFLLDHDIRRFVSFNLMKHAAVVLAGECTPAQYSERATAFAELFIRRAWDIAVRQFGKRAPREFLLVALGSLSERRLLPDSDLDLIFFTAKTRGTAEKAEKFVYAFNAAISESGGRSLETDFRLRPEGEGAPLAVDFKYYEEYLSMRASFWELMSLQTSRVLLASDTRLESWFSSMKEKARMLLRQRETLSADVHAMKKRVEEQRVSGADGGIDLKCGKGGLMEADFALIIADTRRGEKRQIITAAEALALKKNSEYLRTLLLYLRLNDGAGSSVLPLGTENLRRFANTVPSPSGSELMKKIKSVQQAVHRTYEAVLTRL